MTDPYPLDWPTGWRRTPERERDDYLAGHERPNSRSWNTVVARLKDALRLLGARNVVLSTNQPIRLDGLPYATRTIIRDPAAAVYFELNSKEMVLAQDRYHHLICNIRSLALAIEGLRQMQRHGGDLLMERAFTGFEVLPPPDTGPMPWWQVLGVTRQAGADDVARAWIGLAKRYHPDSGREPDDQRMAEVNRARDQAREHLAAAGP